MKKVYTTNSNIAQFLVKFGIAPVQVHENFEFFEEEIDFDNQNVYVYNYDETFQAIEVVMKNDEGVVTPLAEKEEHTA